MEALSFSRLALIIATLIFLGCVNFTMLKQMYTAYGGKYAFFVNQGVNLLYIVYGGAVLYPRMIFTNVVTPEMKKVPKTRFLIMGILDAFGTFFTAMGAAYTPGSLQPLLNQTLIPWTIFISIFYLKKVYSWGEIMGALLIMGGACASALPAILTKHATGDVRSYAVVLYALSNVPMAMSSCYKERNFRAQELDVWYLTQWVSIFQFAVSFLMLPALCLPGFGSPNGAPLSQLPGLFYEGFLCFLETSQECRAKSTMFLLVGYCGVNVMYNTLGLYLTKVASALMNALSYAILLPCTTLLFFTPLVGMVQEEVSYMDLFTLLGLVLVLCGFLLFQFFGRAVDAELPEEIMEHPAVKQSQHRQQSFQERIVGMGDVHGFGMDVAELRRQISTANEKRLLVPLLEPTRRRKIQVFRHEHGDSPLHWHEVSHENGDGSDFRLFGDAHGDGHDHDHGHGHGHGHGHSHDHDGHGHCHTQDNGEFGPHKGRTDAPDETVARVVNFLGYGDEPVVPGHAVLAHDP